MDKMCYIVYADEPARKRQWYLVKSKFILNAERKEESPEEGALESSYQKIQPNKQEIK